MRSAGFANLKSCGAFAEFDIAFHTAPSSGKTGEREGAADRLGSKSKEIPIPKSRFVRAIEMICFQRLRNDGQASSWIPPTHRAATA